MANLVLLRKFSNRSFDWVLFTSVLLMMAIGLAAIYSVDLSRGEQLLYFRKQIISAVIGVVVLFVVSLMQYNIFRTYAKVIYAGALFLLAAVVIAGVTVNGTKGWFNFFGFSFQPMEMAKVAVILMLAYIVSNFGRRFEQPLFFFGTAFVTAVVIGLIMLQPDLGSSLIIGALWFAIMVLVGARRSYLIGMVLVGILTAVVGWFFLLHPYQKERVLTFLDPQRDPLGEGYNSSQALIAVGAGNFFGRGLGFGSQSQLRFLPEAQTDFVFTVIGEELGFAGVFALVTVFGVVLYRLYRIVQRTNDDFVAVTVSGIAILFFIQFFVNAGSNIGLTPITGVTLPFVSYGGSSLIINLFLVGLAESMVDKRY